MTKIRFVSPLLFLLISIFLRPDFAFTSSGPVSDDFNSCSLNTTLWSFVNPANDASVALNGTQAQITVPAGSAHDPYPYNEAAWLKQAADDTDFELEVKFDSPVSSQYQEQGIIIEGENADHFLRFDFYADGSNTKIFAAVLNNGSGSSKVNSTVAGANVAPLWLRVTRTGDLWTQSYSLDGQTWTTSGSFSHSMSVSAVGVFAGNDGSNPAHTALVDYFFNSATPISPEDADALACGDNFSLTLNTVGS
ncbi:MAG: DUF1349 domain-containing protein, partial [Anaerolineae bacterium]|nr:DUF1349 domain-containing protein [Anaerolineae bacterium]